MKRIKPGEYKRAVCSYCTVPEPAVYRSTGIGVCNRFSCSACMPRLSQHERGGNGDHMTEADYQTWGRL